MHLLDRLAQAGMRAQPVRGVIFPDGFGDPDLVDLLHTEPDPTEPIPDLDIAWGPRRREGATVRRRGSFRSPWAELLPGPARTGEVELVEPVGGAHRLCLLYAAWGHEDFLGRRRVAHHLADRGIAALSIMHPLYGSRRVHGGPHAIRSVADFGLQAWVTVREGRALLAQYRPTHELGVAGFSMGAGFTIGTSMLLPWPAAITALAAAPSPARTFTASVIGSRLDDSFDEADREALFEALDGVSALKRAPLPHHAASVLVAARDDGFVAAEEAAVLQAHWPGSALLVLEGGHATTWLLHKRTLAAAIARAFDRTWDGEP